MGKNQKLGQDKREYVIWTLQVTIFTFFLAVVVGLLSQIATKSSDIFVQIFILTFLILVSIIFDSIGVSATSSNLEVAMRYTTCPRVQRIAQKLIINSEKVNNICNDVVGDMCGILSGGCCVNISIKLSQTGLNGLVATIVVSSIVTALTVGGKATVKGISVASSEQIVVMVAKLLSRIAPKKKDKNEHLRPN